MHVLGDIVSINAIKYRNKVALWEEESKITYGELCTLSNRLANSLRDYIGIEFGDRVGIIGRNSLWFAVLLFAAWEIGAVVVPVNWRLKAEELRYILENSEPSVIFCEEEFYGELAKAQDIVKSKTKIITVNRESALSQGEFAELIRRGREVFLASNVAPYDIAMIMYTSGTTGRPKGVVFTHQRELMDLLDHLIELDLEESDIVLLNMPWFHNGGLTLGLMHTLIRGATGVIYGGSFVADVVLRIISEKRISVLNLVPTMLARIVEAKSIPSTDIRSVNKIYYGGAPIPERIQKKAIETFRGTRFYQTYGQTESGMLLVLKPEDHFTERRSFTGRPLCLAVVKAIAEGREVGVGEVGELVCLQRPLAMNGYWRNEEATQEVLRNGWLHTTDLVRVEENGYYTIVGRLKDMIITGGENVYAKEVENVIMEHPEVEEVAVFGLPDDEWGEIVCAALVPREGSGLTQEDIVNYCAMKLAGYKRPKKVFFMKELPKNAAGKVLKNVLRQMLKTE